MGNHKTTAAEMVAAIRGGSDRHMAQADLRTASESLCTAIKAASEAWVKVCSNFEDAAAWQAHKRAQDLVNVARQVYTRAKVAARVAAKGAKR